MISSSDNTQLTEVKIIENSVPKKKYSGVGFFQFGVVALKQKSRWRGSEGNRLNLKKLSVVPEQDEQVIIFSFFLIFLTLNF